MRYCDVSLPVPIDRAFTYSLPETLQERVKPGCRLIVPFGPRKLTGVALRCHDERPDLETREALRLLDSEPVLGQELMKLAEWIAGYYHAPLGEVLRGMLPLGGEMRSRKIYRLTDLGRDAARQLTLSHAGGEPATMILKALEERPLTAAWLDRKFPLGDRALRALERRNFVAAEESRGERDPLRAHAGKLRIELAGGGARPAKLPKSERELLAFLELHPGSHNLKDVERMVRRAGTAARSLARKSLLAISREQPGAAPAPPRAPHRLNEAQQAACGEIAAAVGERQFRVFLLYGITGSGKTEVYLNAIDAALAAGRSALLLVPEIALTPAVAGQFQGRFGDRAAILHSAFTDSERAGEWRRARSGAAVVVVGTRSGVFAPVSNLGLVVVDEEHDQSYKQEETPRYHARDVAIVRAQAAGACVVLGSATPSLESRYNAGRGKYRLLGLPERIEQRPLPAVELIDMRQEFLETRKLATFSRRLLEEIAARLENGEQTMLLLNRRGYSSFAACRACGARIQCVNCAVTLTYHRRDRRLLCHYCSYAERVPEACPQCASEHLYFLGTGSEKVEDELHAQFPRARIARLDRDTVSGKREYESILSGFRERRFDILVGTQMIAKGHDIPNVTLVGVISADIGLGLPDFRAAERTFQLLTQVAGRAGRGHLPGEVLIQTINPGHYAVRMAAAQDYDAFYAKELEFRRLMLYPPFSAMANVLVRSENPDQAREMSALLGQLLTPAPQNMRVLGPAEAPVPRLKSEFRFQMLIKATSRKALHEALRRVHTFALERKWPATALVIDVDPLTLL